jgi:hypothetical protein
MANLHIVQSILLKYIMRQLEVKLITGEANN